MKYEFKPNEQRRELCRMAALAIWRISSLLSIYSHRFLTETAYAR